MGVAGPKSLAIEVKRKIDTFLKSDLHLEVKQNHWPLCGATGREANFLGFRVYLSDRSKKSREKWKHFASIAKYKRRIEARFRATDRRLAQAFVEGAKRDLVKTYKDMLGELSLPLNKANLALASRHIAYPTGNLVRTNPALERWYDTFDQRFKLEMVLAQKFYRKGVDGAILPICGELPGMDVRKELADLRNNFIEGLDKLATFPRHVTRAMGSTVVAPQAGPATWKAR